MKRMPLLILGKRRSGKTTALRRFGRTITDVKGFAPQLMQGKYIFKDEVFEFATPSNLNERKEPKNRKWIVDEFSMCDTVPRGQIVALTDDINNFVRVMKKLKELGYPVIKEVQ